ncbi:MAG: hypothetical protein NTX75_12930 [Proteobacteria bacterium]|nr:hypothetical protein [Pseudomonadota bacterium]
MEENGLWCPLTGELPDVDHIPSDFKYQCLEIIYEARGLCGAGEAELMFFDYTYPENLLEFARTIEGAYGSIRQNSLCLQRPYYYTNEKGDLVLTHTLASNAEQVLSMAGYSKAYGYVDDEAPDYFILAVVAIIEAREALQEALEDKIYNYDDLLDARGLLSKAEKAKSEFEKPEKQSIRSRELKKNIIDQAIKNVFETFPNMTKTLGTVKLRFNHVNADKDFEGCKTNLVEDPKTRKTTVFIHRPGTEKPYKYEERTLETRIKIVIKRTIDENKPVSCKDYIK